MIPREATILVTGASSGIGAAIARKLARPGRVLHLQGRDEDRLTAIAAEVAVAGAEVVTHRIDLLDHGATESAARDLAHDLDTLDAVVHSAGICVMSEIEHVDPADFDRHYAVNLRAPVVLTRALLPALLKARGQVVFINSGAGHQAFPAWGVYAATKFGLRAIADALRLEMAGRGVRVIGIHPGRTATPMQADVHRMEGRAYVPSAFVAPEDVAASVTHALEMPRNAVVTELSIRPGGG
jgi:NADP-dependent 3-hydroxy acid dehydrogenase YdfG